MQKSEKIGFPDILDLHLHNLNDFYAFPNQVFTLNGLPQHSAARLSALIAEIKISLKLFCHFLSTKAPDWESFSTFAMESKDVLSHR